MGDEIPQSPIRGGCPDLEAIAAYVDGRLSGSGRAEMEEHLAACDDCFTIFSETARSEAELGRAESPVVVARPGFSRWWIALPIAAVLVAAAIPLAAVFRSRRRIRPNVAELVAAVGAERPFEPRLTGGFQFGPMAPRYRAAKPLSDTDKWEVLAAAAKIRKHDEASSTPETLDALGAANLVLGKYDDAVSNLEEATLEEPKNARYLTDLSAAYLVRATEKDRADDYPKALEAAEKATELDPSILEAWFNRALALDELPLKSEAAKAWNDYLKRDAKSGWADEARRRLAAIAAIPNHAEEWKKAKARMLAAAKVGDEKTIRQLMPDWCQETREWIEEELLPQWAEAELTGNGAVASEGIVSIQVIADAHTFTSGDEMLRATAADVISSPLLGRRRRATAFIAYEAAKGLHKEFRIPEALEKFHEAAAALDGTDNPLRHWVEYYEASCAYYSMRYDDGQMGFSRAAPLAEERGYLALAARCRMMLGLCLALKEDFGPAFREYLTSEKLLERARENENLAYLSSLVADQFMDLGEPGREWEWRLRAIRRLPQVAASRPNYMVLAACARSLADAGASEAALDLQLPATEFAVHSGPLPHAESAEVEGVLFHEIGADSKSDRAFREASRVVAELADSRHRDRLNADIGFKRAEAEADRYPARSEQALTSSIEYFRRVGLDDYLAEAYLCRGRTRKALQRPSEAARDFEAGLGEVERARRTEPEYGISFFDRARGLIDGLVETEIEQGRPAAALDWVERTRARDLLARRGSGEPLSIERIQAALPPDRTIVYYHALPSKLLEWTVTRSEVRFTSVDITRESLEKRVAQIEGFVRRRDDRGLSGVLTNLYGILIRPLPAKEVLSRLAFVPDGRLALVPFPALRDPATGRYLVESRDVEVAPSGSALSFLPSLRPGRPGSVLSVGFSPADSADGFRSLPNAAGEASRIASFYPVRAVMTGPDATPSAFARLAPEAEVIHFAGHAMANSRAPAQSYLLLASEAREDGRVYARQLAELNLGGVRLVDLSACDTAGGALSYQEGALGLARPFLLAGAGAVAATLWDVPDAGTESLECRFHEELAAGIAPDHARRLAATAAISGPEVSLRSPMIWGAFEVIVASPS